MASLTYAMPMIVNFVSNMERSLEFYRDVLGFHPTVTNEHWTLLNVPGGTTMALHAGGAEKEPGNANSIPVFSIESVKKAKGELEGKGVRVLGDPREVPGGLTLDITDPDGNMIQLLQRTI